MENNHNENTENYPKYKINAMNRNKNQDVLLNFRNSSNKLCFDSNESIGTDIEDITPESEKSEDKNEKIENSFNIFEVIISQFFKCCLCKTIKIKNDMNEKANKIIFRKMDVIVYVRNMILLDLFNQNSLDDNKKNIINFLSRPIISLDKKAKTKFNEFYGNYKEKDFNRFYGSVQELVKRPKKSEVEAGLINITNEHLKDFL